jgi:tight adherence protein C
VNSALLGGLLGLMLAVGVIIAVRASPPMRPIRLADRVASYLGDTPAPSKLLAQPTATSAPFTVLRRLFGPALGDAVGLLDRVVGGRASVRRRLAGLSSRMTVEEFRLEQVVWGTFAMIASALLVVGVGVFRGDINVLLAIGAAIVGLITGVLARDWALSGQLRRREAAMLAEFPVVADLLALAVVAGEAPGNALQRVSRLTGGELARDIDTALSEARSGAPITRALTTLSDRTTLEPFARFLQGLVVAIERGTPMADVLRAQAADVREASKRALLEAGGRKEISMMVPVVFLLLPITVLFALYPGLVTLVSLTR